MLSARRRRAKFITLTFRVLSLSDCTKVHSSQGEHPSRLTVESSKTAGMTDSLCSWANMRDTPPKPVSAVSRVICRRGSYVSRTAVPSL
eukprot:COSAG02_NODE_2423_length_8895_cov_3.455207_5_plen_89_part_00